MSALGRLKFTNLQKFTKVTQNFTKVAHGDFFGNVPKLVWTFLMSDTRVNLSTEMVILDKSENFKSENVMKTSITKNHEHKCFL